MNKPEIETTHTFAGTVESRKIFSYIPKLKTPKMTNDAIHVSAAIRRYDLIFFVEGV